MDGFITIYDLCKNHMSKSNCQYGIFLRDNVVEGYNNNHPDKFKCVSSIDELNAVLINIMTDIIAINKCLPQNLVCRSNDYDDMHGDDERAAVLNDIIVGDHFNDALFACWNDNLNSEYLIYILSVDKVDFDYIIANIKSHFGVVLK